MALILKLSKYLQQNTEGKKEEQNPRTWPKHENRKQR